MLLWLGFLGCTAVIVYCGTKLSRYGDIIAEKTGFGRTWIGLVLMASVTSLPELMTGMSSVLVFKAPDIAVGDVLGSCVFNMLILAILDVLYRPHPISTKAHFGHVLSAGFGTFLLAVVAVSLFFGERIGPLGWIGPYSLILILFYFNAMRMLFQYEKRRIATFVKEHALELQYKDVPMKSAVRNYAANAVVVIIAAAFLPKIGVGIAEMTGLGQSFVGNILIALSTSLPEVVVCVAAVKIDAVDLAIGNLFGSNIFNLFILALDDLFFLEGPILSYADPSHIISTLSAIAMTSIAIIGLTYHSEKKALPLSWDSLGIVIIYMCNIMLLYMYR